MKILMTESAGSAVLRRLLPFVLGIPVFIGWLVVSGDQAGRYEAHFGIAMISVLTVGFLTLKLWLTSRQLNRIDAKREQAESQIAYRVNLLANINDAIVATDANFRLTAWNAAVEAMYGWKAEEVLGKTGIAIKLVFQEAISYNVIRLS